ncbi:MAG: ribosome recycling factor [Candidatus Midichloriaceae bacterium]|jgi:ribosome recycling factor
MESELKILPQLEEKMDSTINSLKKSFNGLRTGRASPDLLDQIKIEAYGDKMPINQLASVTTPDSKCITVQVWDQSMVESVEKAILNSGLGLTPNTEGQVIKLNLPMISGERRKELSKKANEYAEQNKISIRNIRRNGLDHYKKLEKDKDISQDDFKSYSADIQKVTDEYIVKISKLYEEKSKEILKI